MAFRQKTVGQKLSSWKEIAVFFQREERTVKRWEKERGLPVHRVPGGGRASIYAYTEELTAWLHSGQAKRVEDVADPLSEQPGEQAQENGELSPRTGAEDSRISGIATAGRKKKFWIAGIAAGAAVLLVVGFAFSHYFELLSIPGRTLPTIVFRNHSSSHQAAEELYLQGRYHWNKRTPQDLTMALDDFSKAAQVDPGYALAYAGKADCYNLLREFADMPPSQAFPLALAAAKESIELDDSLPEGHRALAFAEFYWKWDVAGSEREFRRAIALNPRDIESHHWYATALMSQARYPEAIAEIERARQIDPASSSIAADRGMILFASGRKAEGVALLIELQAADPGFYSPPAYLSRIYYDQGDYARYFAEAQLAAQLAKDQRQLASIEVSRKNYAAGGEQALFQGILEERLQDYQHGRCDAISVAAAYAQLGKKAEAVQYLEKAYERHEFPLITLADSPSFKILRDTKEFQELMARVHSYMAGNS